MMPSLVERAADVTQRYHFGEKEIFPNVYLAPMAGVTDNAFRELVSFISGGRTGLLVSEFISVEGMTRLVPKICKQLQFRENQRPYCVQIFGSDPTRMGMGAKMVEDAGVDFVEINAGCPAPKVVKKNGGSGLLRDLPRFAEILREVRKSVSIPCSVKVRVGYHKGDNKLPETLKIAEEEGMSVFTIHGRTRQQGYRGLADWDAIAEAKTRAHIPIVGNGDVLTVEDVVHRLETSHVDGICIGRGAMHNPWVFGQVADLYEGKTPREPTLDDQEHLFMHLRDFLLETSDYEGMVLGRMKQITARLVKCLPNSKIWRTKLLRTQTLDEFFETLHRFYESLSETPHRAMENVRELNGTEKNEVNFGHEFKN